MFLEVVEKLTFMFGELGEPEDVDEEQCIWVRASIDFSGPVNGTISLGVPEDVCGEVSANILGLNPEDIEEDGLARDSLMELLNVVCGHIVPAIQETEDDVLLSVPSIDEISSMNACKIARQDDTTCYDLDDSPVMLTLHVETGTVA